MPLWTLLPVFLTGLAVICRLGQLRCQAFAASILLLDWACCTLIGFLGSPGTSWFGMAIIDFAAALTLLVLPRNRRGFIVIAALLAVQIVAHAGFSIVGRHDRSEWNYYWALFWLAWAQALICAAWAGRDAVRMARRNHAAGRGSLDTDAVRNPLDVRGGRR